MHTPSNSPLSSSDLMLEQWPNTSTAPYRCVSVGRPLAIVSENLQLKKIFCVRYLNCDSSSSSQTKGRRKMRKVSLFSVVE